MKKQNKKQKRSITLLEVMIVIFLIGLVGSIVGYNMKGSIEKGKAFKTEETQRQINEIANYEIAQGNIPTTSGAVTEEIKEVLRKSILVSEKNRNNLFQDGWKQEFTLSFENDELKAESAMLTAYNAKHNKEVKEEVKKEGE